MFCHSVDDVVCRYIYAANCVDGCGWPISDESVIEDVAFCNVSNNPPNSNFVADAMIFIIILNSTFTGSFSGGVACIG